jgi:hypothetical protein
MAAFAIAAVGAAVAAAAGAVVEWLLEAAPTDVPYF